MNTSRRTFTARSDTIPSWIRQVIRLVQQTAIEQGIDFVLVGATARDIVLQSVFGVVPGRRTIDLGFGVEIENWEQFAALKSALVATGNFRSVDQVVQRLLYCEDAQPVDLIPFGGVVNESGVISWPPSGDIILDVTGFKEVLAAAILVQIEVDLVVPVASLAGLALLKLLAWTDRGQATNKDADDLHRLLEAYGDAGNEDRLWGSEGHLLEGADHDWGIAGAQLLGKDVAGIVTAAIKVRITKLMESEERVERLLFHMLSATVVIDERLPTRYAELLEAFRRGFLNT